MSDAAARIAELEGRIATLEAFNRRHMDFLDLLLSVDNSLGGLRQHGRTGSLLEVIAGHAKRLAPLDAVGFWLADDQQWSPSFVEPPSAHERLELCVEQEIEKGTFGWALRHNRALVGGDADAPIVLHPLATPSRTLGMFAALPAPGLALPDDILSFLSVLLSTAAYSLENAQLHGELITRNESLEQVVAERTLEATRARRLADAANRAKSEFLSTISHEIRTPINAVFGVAQLLQRTKLDTHQKEYVETLWECGQAARRLLNDVLDLSRIEAGRMELERGEVRPRDIVESTTRLFAEVTEGKGVALLNIVEPDVPEVLEGDANRIRQVLMNLVSNAVKFTAHGSVTLRVAGGASADGAGGQGDAVVRFLVSDTGPGLSAEAQQRLFSPFVQESAAVARQHGGSGLGLSISRRLVELMGGTLAIESAVGAGTTLSFQLRLPRSKQTGGIDRLPLQGRTALVADAHPSRRSIHMELLAQWGLRTVDAGTLADARQELASSTVDLVLADAELAEELAAILPPTTPLLCVAALDGCERAERKLAARLGSVVLARPLRTPELDRGLRLAFGAPIDEAPEGIGSPGAGAGAGLRVLVVDDSPIGRMVVAEMLRQLNAEVVAVGGGEQAIAEVRSNPYDLVFMDCEMPGVDGLEATRLIREDGAGGQRPWIVAQTGRASTGDRERCIDAGMDDYLVKPLTMDDLAAVLGRVRNAPAAHD